jgi:hypothetical protein
MAAARETPLSARPSMLSRCLSLGMFGLGIAVGLLYARLGPAFEGRNGQSHQAPSGTDSTPVDRAQESLVARIADLRNRLESLEAEVGTLVPVATAGQQPQAQMLLEKFLIPASPVSPYFNQEIEDSLWEEERYGNMPVLDPVEGESTAHFCVESPTQDEVLRSLPNVATDGTPFSAESSRNNVRIVVEPLGDKLGECRFYPMVGPARHHECRYKCTVYFDKATRSDSPTPQTSTDAAEEVVYINHDHLIRCAGQ